MRVVNMENEKENKKIFLRVEIVEYLLFLKNNKVVDENIKKKKYKEIVGSVWENRSRVLSRSMRFENILKKENVLEICKEELKNSGMSKGKRLFMEIESK
jgi:hypothetical protein